MKPLAPVLVAAVLALASGLGWAGASSADPGLEPLQISFKNHQAGAPFLDAAGAGLEALVCRAGGESCLGLRKALGRGRDVQEGCAEPCGAVAQVEVYRAKVLLVCEDLGMDGRACGEAVANYIPDGVARKRGAGGASAFSAEFEAQAAALLLANPRLDPALRQSLGDKALRLARALGRSADSSSVDGAASSFAPKPAKAGKALPAAQAAAKPAVPVASAPRLSDEDVDRLVGRNLGAQLAGVVAQNPVGQAVVKQVRRMPAIAIESLAEETHARYDDEAGVVEFNSRVIAGILERTGKAAVEDPEDAAAVKRLLVEDPSLFAVVARIVDSLYVHELTHAVQFQRWGDGPLGRAVAWARHKLNGDKYPVEYELEASGNEMAYFHGKVKADPTYLKWGNEGDGDSSEYDEWLADLSRYRKDRAALYEEECSAVKDLKLYGWERGPLDRGLNAQAGAWPRQSYEGSMLLAGRKAAMAFPAPAIDLLGQAYDRASKSGFLASTKPEMKELLFSVVARFEETLSKSSSYSLGDGQKETLRKLSMGLGVSLPPRT
ncbi:MAG: hypothetical protein WC943_17395, partial [Elusimicrobiota bacterium]